MAARAIWTGSISFGLVNVPVRLYSATQQKDIRFHEFDQKTGKRIRHKRITEGSSREIDYEDVAKGYEVSKGKYVVLERDELEAAEWEPSKYKDRYRQRVLSLIKRKQEGKEIVAEPDEDREPPTDLMDALRASVEEMKKKKKGSRSRRK